MSRTSRLSSFAVALVVGIGCSPAPPAPDVALTLGGEPILYGEFEAFVERRLEGSAAALEDRVASALFDQFVEERLLDRLARDRGLGDDELEPFEALIEGLEVPEPTEDEIRAVYQAAPERFERPDRVRLRQILVEDEATARRALGELRAGREFARVAERLSPSGEVARSLESVVSRAQVPAAFERTIFSLEEGDLSGPIQTDYGFYVFQVVERLPERRLTLAEATPGIRVELEQLAADRHLAALVKSATGRYNVRVYERNLPFAYRGRFGGDPPPTATP